MWGDDVQVTKKTSSEKYLSPISDTLEIKLTEAVRTNTLSFWRYKDIADLTAKRNTSIQSFIYHNNNVSNFVSMNVIINFPFVYIF